MKLNEVRLVVEFAWFATKLAVKLALDSVEYELDRRYHDRLDREAEARRKARGYP